MSGSSVMLVVAAAIRDDGGSWLLQQRPPGKHHAGLWEFPGGKVDRGEAPRAALRREVVEELGLFLEEAALIPLGFAEQPAADGRPPLVLLLFQAEAIQGAPESREGQEWGWFNPAEAAALPLAPLDRLLLPCLPGRAGETSRRTGEQALAKPTARG